MQLPVELICEIIFCLVADECVCFDIKCGCPADDCFCYNDKCLCPTDETGFDAARISWDRLHDLASLRLFNEICCRCATPVFFGRVDAVTWNGALKGISRLQHISTSRHADCVRRVDFGIVSPSDLPDSELSRHAEHVAGLLPPFLARLPNLTALGFVYSSADTRILQPVLGALSVALLDLHLPNLQELHINYPVAHDLARLLQGEPRTSRNSIAQVFLGLRHLGIHLTESKGQVQWYPSQRPRYDAPLNSECVGNVIELVALAENLQSLDMGSCEGVDLDSLAVPRSWRLRSLRLQGVTLSPRTLMRLIRGSRDTLESVLLFEVGFESGTWEQVLQAAARMEPPRLFNFQMTICFYSEEGSSAELTLGVDGPVEYDDPPPIITTRTEGPRRVWAAAIPSQRDEGSSKTSNVRRRPLPVCSPSCR
ncbi:hypothetical protein PG991_012026 [Apiospora marii]|uniref:F-box domain-containing protein n=1 Tax=Apiospora marii TaxID=335849 RepID=A0ABR1RG91_9PEZI